MSPFTKLVNKMQKTPQVLELSLREIASMNNDEVDDT